MSLPSTIHAPVGHRRTKVFLALLFVAYIAASLVIYLVRYAPHAPHLGDDRAWKQQLLSGSHGAFTSAAFGASHALNGFAPVEFDNDLLPQRPTHSLNLGLWGGTNAEQRYLALAFAAQLKPPPGGQP